VDNKPPVIGSERPINNSVIQTVHVQSPRGGLWEWAMVALLGVVVISVLIGGTFLIAKSSFKSYITLVQSTIRDLESPTVVTNTQIITNTVMLPVKISEFVNTSEVKITSIKWRALGAPDGDIIHVKYQITNDSIRDVVGLETTVVFSNTNRNVIYKQVITDGSVNTETPVTSKSIRHGELAIPFGESLSVQDVSIGVKGVKFRQ
jgi:hypothetical protein